MAHWILIGVAILAASTVIGVAAGKFIKWGTATPAPDDDLDAELRALVAQQGGAS